jgi:hypothetical protein
MRIFLVSFFLIIANISLAINVPADFLYQGYLIDPNCILESNSSKVIDLKECSKHQGKKITDYILEDGGYGYQYVNIENNYPGSATYKYLGKIGDLHIVHAFLIGGSVSRLNYINYLKINGDVLHLVKRGPAGDRSFGGISNAKIENNSLVYDMALTAKLFVINFTKDQAANPNLEFLSDCATCQFALVRHVDNKMHSITLNQEVSTSNQSEVGQCFNNIHQEYIAKKHFTLTTQEAKIFASKFISECASSNKQ